MKLSILITLRASLCAVLAYTNISSAFVASEENNTIQKSFDSTSTDYWIYGGNNINYGSTFPVGSSADFDHNVNIVIKDNKDVIGYVTGGNYSDILLDDADELWGTQYFESATFKGNTTISLNSSTASVVTGGSNVYQYDGNAGASIYTGEGRINHQFEGNTSITVDKESAVGFIVGGNYGNSLGSSFIGDTTIVSHQSAPVYDTHSAQNNAMGIIGGSVASTENDMLFDGNTNVRITGMLSSDSNWIEHGGGNGNLITYSGTFGSIIGGLSGDYSKIDTRYSDSSDSSNERILLLDMRDKVATLDGNTKLTIDHTETTVTGDSNNFIFNIIGGSMAANGMDINHVDSTKTEAVEGKIELNIYSQDSINFQKAVVGANVNSDSEAVSRSGALILMRDKLSETITSEVNIHVTGGNFAAQSAVSSQTLTPTDYDNGNMFISGSLSYGGGKVTTTTVTTRIDGGLFDILIGANASTASANTDCQSGAIWQEAYATYAIPSGGLYGAYSATPNYDNMASERSAMPGVDHTSGSMHSDDVKLTINGGVSQLVVAGNYIDGNVSHITGGATSETDSTTRGNAIDHLVSTLNSSALTITGGTHENITGGSYIGANITTGGVANIGEDNIHYKATQGGISVNISGAGTVIKGDYIAAAGILETYDTESYLTQYFGSKLAKAFYERFRNGVDLYPGEGASQLALNAMKHASLSMTTESTSISLDAKVEFQAQGDEKITISGGYQTIISDGGKLVPSPLSALAADSSQYNAPMSISELLTFASYMNDASTGSTLGTDWVNAYNELVAQFADISYLDTLGATVQGNRLLNLNDTGTYRNLANVAFVDFDEVSTAAGAVVDFGLNEQDLDSLNGRHIVDDTIMDGISTTDTNSVRKTGTGTLILGAKNGQTGKEAGLSLDVQQGKVVLAANSAATNQTNFETLRVREGSTLDMSAGSNVAGAAAGINGHLLLEGMSTVIADAGRSASGMGTSMTDGKLTVDAKFMLSLTNMDNLQAGLVDTFTLGNGTSLELGVFNIVLFSNLSYTDPTNVAGIDFMEGTWYGESAKIAIASDYMMSNFYLGNEDAIMDVGDVFIVWRENGDMVLTSATSFTIPEPSTATLSLLALAGLLRRRRRSS